MSEFTKEEAELYDECRKIWEELANPLHPCNLQGQVNRMLNSDFSRWESQPFINIPTQPNAINPEENKDA